MTEEDMVLTEKQKVDLVKEALKTDEGQKALLEAILTHAKGDVEEFIKKNMPKEVIADVIRMLRKRAGDKISKEVLTSLEPFLTPMQEVRKVK